MTSGSPSVLRSATTATEGNEFAPWSIMISGHAAVWGKVEGSVALVVGQPDPPATSMTKSKPPQVNQRDMDASSKVRMLKKAPTPILPGRRRAVARAVAPAARRRVRGGCVVNVKREGKSA